MGNYSPYVQCECFTRIEFLIIDFINIGYFLSFIRLPIGGFRTIVNQPFHSQRTSVLTLPREINSTGTSTTSSKLSDSRILREVRE